MSLVAAVGVAGRDDHAGVGEAADHRRRGPLGRERDERCGRCCRPVSVSKPASSSSRILAESWMPLRLAVEKGALDMDAEHARDAGLDRRVDGADRLAHHRQIVADQGRQEAGRAEARGAPRPIVAIVSTVGASLNRAPPPPLTWTSMKPGHQHAGPPDRPVAPAGNRLGGDDRGDPAALDDQAPDRSRSPGRAAPGR